MEVEFEISMVDELKYFLGFQINQMEDGIFISQAKYAKNIVKKFGLETSKSKRTPFATHVKVTKDEDGKVMDINMYRSMIESLLYLTASRLDIAHCVGICATYQADPKESHLNLVKRILKYIKGEPVPLQSIPHQETRHKEILAKKSLILLLLWKDDVAHNEPNPGQEDEIQPEQSGVRARDQMLVTPIMDDSGKSQNPSSDSLEKVGCTDTLLKSAEGGDNADIPVSRGDIDVGVSSSSKDNGTKKVGVPEKKSIDDEGFNPSVKC
ncbi:hypothetical protein LIER_41480 [Lithospermum erythrorhizon]|uniref:Mitochondrial protein n=1 Tax=Lithospermum erythrorhizon TaxID=34254 RepID=A0AAV3RDB1_LITER